MRISCLALIAAVAIPYTAHAQTPAPALRFEVASIRPTISSTEFNQQRAAAFQAGRGGGTYCVVCFSGLRVDSDGVIMKVLISDAYGIDARLIVAPDWVNAAEARFAIHAVMPVGSTKDQYPEMLRALLEDRFHLVVHRAIVEQTAYALVTAKNGPKLKKPGDIDRAACDEWSDAGGPVGSGNEVCRTGQVVGDRHVNVMMMTNSAFGPSQTTTSRDTSLGTNESHNEYFRIAMPVLAKLLSGNLSSAGPFTPGAGSLIQVVDHTGIEGPWDVVLDRSFGETDTALSNYSASLEKQGLRLERITAPVEKLIIDKVDRIPTEN